LFLDGSLGARTAWLRQPYADAPDTRGTPLFTPVALQAIAERAHARGLQLMVHAIGDAALDLALDALEPVAAGGNPLRHRLEHVEVTPSDLVARLAQSAVWVCAQPNFAARWSQPGGMNAQRLGARLAHCNAYRSLHEAGVPIGFGSDTMPLGPALGLRGAVLNPVATERLAVDRALRAYTEMAAALVHGEHRHGRIAPGLAADFALLDQDPRAIHDPGDLQIVATYLGGNRVHGPVAAPRDAC
jgi:predicted amidohydrolase YtcJ